MAVGPTVTEPPVRAARCRDRMGSMDDPLGFLSGTPDRRRDTGMVSGDNVEVVRRLYEKLRALTVAGDLDEIPADRELADLLDPEVKWHGTIGGLSEGVVVRGPDEAARFMLEDSQEWDELVYEPTELIEVGDAVVVLQHERRRGRQSGVAVEADTAAVLRLRDGRIWRCQGYMEQEEALRAVGLAGR
jgi:ketosteroid isomerase-like protein